VNIQIKKEIRKSILENREAVDSETRKQWDRYIFNSLTGSDFYKKAKYIFAFVSFRSEVDTHNIILQALKDNKTICVPKIRSKEKGMELYIINSLEDLKSGYFGILEPVEGCEEADIDKIDLILMPGAAFDRAGGRVGYGAGFYDRFISKLGRHADKIALAYHIQLMDSVPMDETDERIDGIITNEEFIIFEKKA
jgi:5-formyltetrahydrofolate cyclo-ligase